MKNQQDILGLLLDTKLKAGKAFAAVLDVSAAQPV